MNHSATLFGALATTLLPMNLQVQVGGDAMGAGTCEVLRSMQKGFRGCFERHWGMQGSCMSPAWQLPVCAITAMVFTSRQRTEDCCRSWPFKLIAELKQTKVFGMTPLRAPVLDTQSRALGLKIQSFFLCECVCLCFVAFLHNPVELCSEFRLNWGFGFRICIPAQGITAHSLCLALCSLQAANLRAQKQFRKDSSLSCI